MDALFYFGSAVLATAIAVSGAWKNDLAAGVFSAAYAALLLCVIPEFLGFGALLNALLLWVHHVLKHWRDDMSDETTCATLQLKDISNHETWIVASLTVAVTVYVERYYVLCDHNI